MEETQRYDNISSDITFREHLISSRYDAQNNAKDKTKQEEKKTKKKKKIAFNPLQESALIDTKTNNSNHEVRVTDNIFNNNVLTKAFNVQSNIDVAKLKNMDCTNKDTKVSKKSVTISTKKKKRKKTKCNSSAKENIRTDVRVDNLSDKNKLSSISNDEEYSDVLMNIARNKSTDTSNTTVSYSSVNYEFHEANHAIINTFAIILDFFMRNDKRKGYCLVCDMTIQVCQYKDIQKYLCRHIRSKKHTNMLSAMIEDEKKSVNNGRFFDKLTLARDYIITDNNNDEFTECLLCKSKHLPYKIKKNEELLHKHMTDKAHKDAKISWELPIQNALQSIHNQFRGQYEAKKYCCEFCYYQSPSELCFMKHLRVPYHVTRLMNILDYANRYKFYFCNVCLILWFGSVDTSNCHHEQTEHKQNIKYGPLINNIPEQLMQFLEMSGPNAEILLAYSDRIYNDNVIKDLVIYSFETHLRKYIPNIKAYPFGSRISGLGCPESDIDIFLDCNYTYEGKNSSRHQSQNLITLIVQYLVCNKRLWNVQDVILNSRTPIAKVLHIPSGLICDISVTNGLAVENTKMIKSFNFAFPPCRKLILFLKQWLYLSGLSGSHLIKNYALTWCVIFYFQILLVFPCISELIKFKNKSWLISGWEVGVSHNFNVNTLNYSFEEFLLGFFLFYADFKYKKKIICPLLGRPIQKDFLNNLSDLPQDMAPYIAYMQNNNIQEAPEAFPISPLCVQDPFDLSHNLTKAINNKELKIFQNNCAVSAKILKIISPTLKTPFMPY